MLLCFSFLVYYGTNLYHYMWASTSTLMSAISNIRHWHLLFRYRKKICRTENCHSDIGKVPISTSESILISDIQKILITSARFEPKAPVFKGECLTSQPLCDLCVSDAGYQIKLYSDIRYNVWLRSLQSDIGSSDIKFSPISLITDIGVSAHLWSAVTLTQKLPRMYYQIYSGSVGCNWWRPSSL